MTAAEAPVDQTPVNQTPVNPTPVNQTPVKSRRAAALPPEERRSMIVAATLPLLLEHGDRVTSRQIAEAAGIAEGTIFRVFADKDEIIVAVVEAALDPAPLEAALDDDPRASSSSKTGSWQQS